MKYIENTKFQDRTGNKRGLLEPVRYGGLDENGKPLWICVCDCDKDSQERKEIIFTSRHLTHSQSCGCLSKISHKKTHGESKTYEYRTWVYIKSMCCNPNNSLYKDYGALGIIISEDWKNSYINFINDIGYRPSNDHVLFRIDSKGNFNKENYKWFTKSEVNNIKKQQLNLQFNGGDKFPTSNNIKNLVGSKFGKLEVIRYDGCNKHGKAIWICHCDCEKELEIKREIPITGAYLLNGDTQSCGCIVKSGDNSRTHGLSYTPEYWILVAMKERCYNPNCEFYYCYGGRGIKICDRWLESVVNFVEDMKPRPGPEYSIDRINNDGNYEKDNCRWATYEEQANNKRTSCFLEFEGVKLTVSQLAEKLNIPAGRLRNRIKKGWTVEEAITIPLHGKRKVL